MKIRNVYLDQELLPDWKFSIGECKAVYEKYMDGYFVPNKFITKEEVFCMTYAKYLVGQAFYYGQSYPVSKFVSVPTSYKWDGPELLLFWKGFVDLGKISGYKGEFVASTLQDIYNDL